MFRQRSSWARSTTATAPRTAAWRRVRHGPRRPPLAARPTPSLAPRVEGVPQAVADEVDAQDEQRDQDAGRQPEPRGVLQDGRRPGLDDHVAEARLRRLDAEAEERQRRFEQDRAGDAERRDDRERADEVRQQVARDDRPVVARRRREPR